MSLKHIVATLSVALACVSTSALASPVSAQVVDPAVETCLRTNADRVSARAASLTDAVEFLLNDVCAVEVSLAQQRIQQARFERMHARVCENGAPTNAALQSDPGDDADTAAFLGANCDENGAWSTDGMEDSVAIMTSAAVATPEDRALAARLILEARP